MSKNKLLCLSSSLTFSLFHLLLRGNLFLRSPNLEKRISEFGNVPLKKCKSEARRKGIRARGRGHEWRSLNKTQNAQII